MQASQIFISISVSLTSAIIMRLAYLAVAYSSTTITHGFLVPTIHPQCAPHYFTDDVASIDFLNKMISVSQAHIETLLAPVDPLHIGNQNLGPSNFETLGSELLVATLLTNLSITGLSSVILAPIEVQDPLRIKINASFAKPIGVSGTALINVTTLTRKPFRPCVLSILHPFKCPPKILEFDFNIQISQITVSAMLYAEWLKCPANAASPCSDLSLSDLMGLVNPAALPNIMNRIKSRMIQANVSQLSVNFDRLDNLTYRPHDSSAVSTYFLTKALKAFQKRLNKKEKLYVKVKNTIDDGGMQAANAFIEGMSSEFGRSCVDAQPAFTPQ